MSPKNIVAKTPPQTTIVEAQRIPVRSIYDSTMRRTSSVTSELYEWSKIGDVVLVIPEDVEYLLQLRLGGRSCCGGTNQDGNKIFELA